MTNPDVPPRQGDPKDFPVDTLWVNLVLDACKVSIEDHDAEGNPIYSGNGVPLHRVLEMASGVNKDDVVSEGFQDTPFGYMELVTQNGWDYHPNNVIEAFGNEILRLREKYESHKVNL